jgi:hypothetical protein
VSESGERRLIGATARASGPRYVVGAVLVALAVLLGSLAGAGTARASDLGATWAFAPAQAPPAPTGAQASPFPTALGQVGDIEFWAPNRGVLITGGNGFVPAGLYAYDGVSWHQLSTVCGGAGGRIAWAGPDEFWTISDQRPGQTLGTGFEPGALLNVSLCHFAGGQVVASYAMPLQQPDSYRPMNAATCSGPSNCWFGGALGEPPNSGAFHLHWNGAELSVVYSPQDHAVASMALHAGQIYESVQLAGGDGYGSESTTSPPLLHTIVATDPTNPFHNVVPANTQNTACAPFCPPLPEYGSDSAGHAVAPVTLAGLALSSDFSAAGTGPATPQLWAVAGPGRTSPTGNQGVPHPIALRLSKGIWTQVVPNLANFAAGEDPVGVAADPGEAAAWVTIKEEGADGARVDLLSSGDGGATWSVAERDELGPQQGVGERGEAGPIACPAAHECWLATSEGWLFHLTNGAALEPDADPFFDGAGGVITFRPQDGGQVETPGDEPPEDDSLQNQQPPPASAPLKVKIGGSKPKKAKPLIAGSHSHLEERQVRVNGREVTRDVLVLTFKLRARAHVWLLAELHGKVVARTPKRVLEKGKRQLQVTLDPKRWPTKLKLEAHPAGR